MFSSFSRYFADFSQKKQFKNAVTSLFGLGFEPPADMQNRRAIPFRCARVSLALVFLDFHNVECRHDREKKASKEKINVTLRMTALIP